VRLIAKHEDYWNFGRNLPVVDKLRFHQIASVFESEGIIVIPVAGIGSFLKSLLKK
jgi:hypothetical protein